MALDIYGGVVTSKANVNTWSNHGGLGQQWFFVSDVPNKGEELKDGKYSIISVADNGYALDVFDDGGDGANLQVYSNRFSSNLNYSRGLKK